MQRHVGIYPGTFDPIHNGHIAFALEALRKCEIDEVIFVPERVPRGKDTSSNISHRIAMIEQAIADIPQCSMAVLDDERFTVKKTLPKLRELRNGAKLTMLMGSDVARSLTKWPDIAALAKSVSFVIGVRTGDDTDDLDDTMKALGKQCSHPIEYTFIDTPSNHVASTHIRKNKTSLMLHPTTHDYIRRHDLYN